MNPQNVFSESLKKSKQKFSSRLRIRILGGVHKLRLQNLAFFDHLPPSVYILYGMKVYKKQIFLTTYPPPLVNVVCERPLIRKEIGTYVVTRTYRDKGQLISKGLFVLSSFRPKTQRNFFKNPALASKKRSNQKTLSLNSP